MPPRWYDLFLQGDKVCSSNTDNILLDWFSSPQTISCDCVQFAGAMPSALNTVEGEGGICLGCAGFDMWLMPGEQASANDSASEQTPKAAEQMIEKGRLLGLDTGRLPALEQALAAFHAWEQEATTALDDKGMHTQFLPSFAVPQPRLPGCTLGFAEPVSG